MLLNCPECDLQVSDKAMVCPHCGYPLQTRQKYPENRKKPLKRRRLPNGFGQISEIKGRYLRKPFRAMVTVGFDETGHPISKLLKPEAYFETYNDAYQALVEYHKNPYDQKRDITIKELYELWSEEYYKTMVSSNMFVNAWRYCDPIKNIKVDDCKPAIIKKLIDEASVDNKLASENIKNYIKTLLNLMMDYAVENGIIDRNYSRAFSYKSKYKVEKSHQSFTDEEMKTLWDHKDEPFVDILLIQCYTGLRPQELGLIELNKVNINEGWIQCGMKTEAGKDRIIPIHKAIEPFILKYQAEAIELNSQYLINVQKTKNHFLNYQKYIKIFIKIKNKFNLDESHTPHDCRKQFVTMAKKYHLDEYAIKRIVGHTISDITEAVYTDRDFQWLYDEMQKIKVYE